MITIGPKNHLHMDRVTWTHYRLRYLATGRSCRQEMETQFFPLDALLPLPRGANVQLTTKLHRVICSSKRSPRECYTYCNYTVILTKTKQTKKNRQQRDVCHSHKEGQHNIKLTIADMQRNIHPATATAAAEGSVHVWWSDNSLAFQSLLFLVKPDGEEIQ